MNLQRGAIVTSSLVADLAGKPEANRGERDSDSSSFAALLKIRFPTGEIKQAQTPPSPVLPAVLLSEGTQSNRSWLLRATDGFIGAAKKSSAQPLTTLCNTGFGLASSSLVYRTLNSVSDRFGVAGKIVKIGLGIAPVAVAAYQAAQSRDTAEEFGRSVFDLSLFWGTGKAASLVSPIMPMVSRPP